MKLHLAFCFFLLSTISTIHAQKIGLLLDSYVIDRWYADEKFFTDKVRSMGAECIVEMPHGDADAQVKLGQKLIAQGVDVIVLVATDAVKALQIISEAGKAGIPVIAYDRLIHSSDVAYYIGYNSVKVGRLQAQYALDKVPNGNYVVINGPASDNNSFLFRNGQMSVLQSAINTGKINVVGNVTLDSWSELEAMMKMSELFASMKGAPDAIIAPNDAVALGTVQSYPKGWQKIVITGQDADPPAVRNIIAGLQSMTIYKPIRPLAEKAAEVAVAVALKNPIDGSALLKDGDYAINAFLLDPVVVDSANYKDTVVKDGYFTD